MNLLRFPSYHLSLLQLENYHLARYAHAALKRYLPPKELRQPIVWTAKLKIVAALAAILIIGFIGLIGPLGLIGLLIFPFFLILATLLISPVDWTIKKIIISRAQRKLKAISYKLKAIVGITGSYGKTTMKELVAATLSPQYHVLKTPENINTPLGIARVILRDLAPETEIFIVEMGAYHRGDIAALCALTPPDIAIITGINEAHLERFSSIENTIQAKFEIAREAKSNALVILNKDNELIMQNYTKHVGGRETLFYSAREGAAVPPTQLLGGYAAGAIRAALMVAERLNVPREKAAAAIATVKPLPHRLEPIATANNILIIDDSYNGNPAGAREAMAVLARYVGRRKLYITPGLVETGKENESVHRALGRELAAAADLVILIKNSATVHIKRGLLEQGFPAERIKEFESAPDAHRTLPSILQSGDVALFQNDWPDQYI